MDRRAVRKRRRESIKPVTARLGPQYLPIIAKVFNQMDTDVSGTLNCFELQCMWRIVFPEKPEREVRKIADGIYQDLDSNGDGDVSWGEIENYFLSNNEKSEIDIMLDQGVLARHPTQKELIWAILEPTAPKYGVNPRWFPAVRLISQFTTNAAILISIITFIMESLPEYQRAILDGENATFELIETCCIAIFTVEFFFRMFSCPVMLRYWVNRMTWVDVLAIVPFYIGVALGDNPSGAMVTLRVLRLLRLLRLLKLGNKFKSVQLLLISTSRTLTPVLVSMVGMNGIAVTLYGSLLWTFERSEAKLDKGLLKWVRLNTSRYSDAGEVIDFQSIPQGMWWSLVTMTTVGYGDMYPTTDLGRTAACMTIMTGLILTSFPLTLLAASFADTMDEYNRKKDALLRGKEFEQSLLKHGGLEQFGEQLKGSDCGDESPLVIPTTTLQLSPASLDKVIEIVGALAQAMKGFGTDEDSIYSTLGKVESEEQWGHVKREFKRRFPNFNGGDVLLSLRDEMDEDELARCRGIMKEKSITLFAEDEKENEGALQLQEAREAAFAGRGAAASTGHRARLPAANAPGWDPRSRSPGCSRPASLPSPSPERDAGQQTGAAPAAPPPAAAAAPPPVPPPRLPYTVWGAPGYYVTVADIAVTVDMGPGTRSHRAPPVMLPKGHGVCVQEVVRRVDMKRLRGRTDEPEGWIPLEDLTNGYRWLRVASEEDSSLGKWFGAPIEVPTSSLATRRGSALRSAGIVGIDRRLEQRDALLNDVEQQLGKCTSALARMQAPLARVVSRLQRNAPSGRRPRAGRAAWAGPAVAAPAPPPGAPPLGRRFPVDAEGGAAGTLHPSLRTSSVSVSGVGLEQPPTPLQ